ncbi:MAG: hypothetical protein ABI294_08465, partial [Casimicrobiaceae bacterium]
MSKTHVGDSGKVDEIAAVGALPDRATCLPSNYNGMPEAGCPRIPFHGHCAVRVSVADVPMRCKAQHFTGDDVEADIVDSGQAPHRLENATGSPRGENAGLRGPIRRRFALL